jgi:serine/threonine-protein kinase PknG
MEYVDGLVLSEVERESRQGGRPLGEPLRVEHVIACGVQILAAFEYLHSRGRVYSDMKPENVIVRPGKHGGPQANRIKVIDMGAVRKIGTKHGIVGTKIYLVSQEEIDKRGLTAQSDIYALGITLGRLSGATRDRSDSIAVGLESYNRTLARATHEDPYRRFATAAEMAQQLQGVQREIASSRDGTARPAPSTVFAPTAKLLDAGLGAVPALDRWTGGMRRDPEAPLADGRPPPDAVAIGLPEPRVNPGDPAAAVLAVTGAPDPRRLLEKLSALDDNSVEVHLAQCRAYLELAAGSATPSRELDDATGCVEQARRLLGSAADYDWRLQWHHGLLALGRGQIPSAENAFDAVYDSVPGEDAPKLALAYCAERRGNPSRASQLYQAIWRRDHSQVSAAFGLARLRLSDGDRAGAVAVLDTVPRESRHFENAAIASVLILSGRVGSDPPASGDLGKAAERLPTIYLDGGDASGEVRHRLTTVVREAGLDWVGRHAARLPVDDEVIFGRRPDESTLRDRLEKSYRALARQARDADAHALLLDLANQTRPMTLL